MRRIAITFGIFVVVVVGALNFVDSKYPSLLQRIQTGTVVPASAPGPENSPAALTAGSAKAAPSPGANAARAPLEDVGNLGLYPGAHVDKFVYGARPYVDMTVVSVSNQNVVLRNDRELVSIPTGSLPDDLRRMAIAYLSGSEGTGGAAASRSGAPAFPAPTPANPAPQPPPTAPVVQARPRQNANAQPDFEALAWQAARDRAERWLRFERKRRPTDIVPLVTGVDLKTPLPMTGLPGYWKVRGRGYVATYQSERGGTFHDFEVTVVLNSQGEVVRADIDIL